MALISHAGADAVLYGGVIREDVMDKIWNISPTETVLTNLCSKGSHTNKRVEFVQDTLAASVTNNAVVEGADSSKDNGKFGERLGNYTQTATKEVKITDQAEAANSIGGMARLARQIRDRQTELRLDVESQMCTHQASVAGDATSAAGISAGIGAQLKTNVKFGATGAVGGFNTTTGLFVAPTPGTKRALSETLIRDTLQSVYEQGGNTSVAMARPIVIRKLSEYLFGSSARVATLSSDQKQDGSQKALTAYGSVNVFVTDFGQTIALRDNRQQKEDAAAVSSMYFLDGTHLKQSFLEGYKVTPLAKNGLYERRMMSVMYSLLVLNEKSQGAILAIDEALAVVA
jgi:hypothetical protein